MAKKKVKLKSESITYGYPRTYSIVLWNTGRMITAAPTVRCSIWSMKRSSASTLARRSVAMAGSRLC